MSEPLILYGPPGHSPALRHEVPLAIIDPLLLVEHDGRRTILTTSLETARIAEALPDAELLDMFDLGLRDLIAGGLPREEAVEAVAARVVERLGLRRAVVPPDFPLRLGDTLRARGVELVVDEAAVALRRRAKTGREREGVRAAQRAAEAGMAAAAAVLRAAQPGADGDLRLDGETLTAERVRAAVRTACAEHDAPAPPEIMVVSVRSAGGHDPGSGPLPACLPITVDLWPRHEETGCWADMTRTFVVGEPAPEHAERIAAMESLVRAALEDAREHARPGVTGRELFDRTCDRFEAAGWPTQRTGPDPEHPSRGFQFSLGHGVGLDVHEEPGLGLAGRDPLVEGDVLAVEPGLDDPVVGGVRFEDLLLITADGCETLTRYPYDLAP